MKNLKKLIAAVVLAVAVLDVLVGWSWERKPVVTSEALPCVEMGNTLVCPVFDFSRYPE